MNPSLRPPGERDGPPPVAAACAPSSRAEAGPGAVRDLDIAAHAGLTLVIKHPREFEGAPGPILRSRLLSSP